MYPRLKCFALNWTITLTFDVNRKMKLLHFCVEALWEWWTRQSKDSISKNFKWNVISKLYLNKRFSLWFFCFFFGCIAYDKKVCKTINSSLARAWNRAFDSFMCWNASTGNGILQQIWSLLIENTLPLKNWSMKVVTPLIELNACH